MNSAVLYKDSINDGAQNIRYPDHQKYKPLPKCRPIKGKEGHLHLQFLQITHFLPVTRNPYPPHNFFRHSQSTAGCVYPSLLKAGAGAILTMN